MGRHSEGRGLGYGAYRAYLEALRAGLVGRLGPSLLAAVLYGSVARGTAEPESDLDLLVVLREAPSSYYARLAPILEVVRELEDSAAARGLEAQGLAPRPSFLVLSEEEAKQNRYVFLDMVEEAVILWDPEGFFARRMSELRRRVAELGAKRVFLPDGTWYWDLKPDLTLGEVFEL